MPRALTAVFVAVLVALVGAVPAVAAGRLPKLDELQTVFNPSDPAQADGQTSHLTVQSGKMLKIVLLEDFRPDVAGDMWTQADEPVLPPGMTDPPADAPIYTGDHGLLHLTHEGWGSRVDPKPREHWFFFYVEHPPSEQPTTQELEFVHKRYVSEDEAMGNRGEVLERRRVEVTVTPAPST